MGPAFAKTPGIGTLDWGLTAAPITYDPPYTDSSEVKNANPSLLRIPALAGIPVAVVSGETSVQSAYAPQIVDFLVTAGAAAELLHLPNYGVLGNGHGLIYEKNSDQALEPVLRWLEVHTGVAKEDTNKSISRVDNKATMIVTYNGDPAARFDRDYYVHKHLPLVMDAWNPYGLEAATALFPAKDDCDDTIARYEDYCRLSTLNQKVGMRRKREACEL